MLRREEVRTGEKYVGIGKNGRKLLRMRWFTWDLRLTKTKKNKIPVRLHVINTSSQSPLWERLISHIYSLFSYVVISVYTVSNVRMRSGQWMDLCERKWSWSNFEHRDEICCFARESRCSSVGVVPPAAHIRTKHPPNTSQKLHCLKCLAECDLCTVFTIQLSWRWNKIL